MSAWILFGSTDNGEIGLKTIKATIAKEIIAINEFLKFLLIFLILAGFLFILVITREAPRMPEMFTPYQVNFSGKCFVSNSGSLSGPYLNGNVSYLNQMEKKAGNSYSRNLTYLLPGDYNFTLDLSSVPPQSIVHITIYSGGEIFYRSFNSSKVITFNYTIKEYEPNVYFAINDSKGSVSVNNLRFDMYNYYQINS